MDIPRLFEKKIEKTFPNGLSWELVGVLTKRQEVYTLSHDSKILGGIFEILCEPIIRSIAEDEGFILEKGVQNQYPEYTLSHPGETRDRVAIDVKSTYRNYDKNGKLKPFGFTLGSYRSYLRDSEGRKGILYPYAQYSEHWIIGFVYTRNEKCQITQIRSIIDAASLESPFRDIEYFVQQKHLIAGKVPGSGNTTNIGSIKSNRLDDFREGKKGFSSIQEFEAYWTAYKLDRGEI